MRIRQPSKVGIGVARKRLDICVCCQTFRATVEPAVTKQLMDIKHGISGIFPSYFDGIDFYAERDMKSLGTNAAGDVQLKCLQDVGRHLAQHRTLHADGRAELTEGGKIALGIAEAEALVQVEERTEQLREFAVHWSLNKYLRDCLRVDKERPEPNTVYILSDWKDRVENEIEFYTPGWPGGRLSARRCVGFRPKITCFLAKRQQFQGHKIHV